MTRRRWLMITVGVVVVAAVALVGQQAALWWGARSPADEAERLAALVRVQPRHNVAEIGAGRGEMARIIGAKVLPGGRLFVTELNAARLADLRSLVAEQRWSHADVRRGETSGTGLPDACCDVIYMRHVFHHFEDPAIMAAALRRAAAPGGHLAIIDFAPHWVLNLVAPVAHGDGHGAHADEVIRALTAAGFTLQHHDPRWTAGTFLILVRAPG